MNDAVRQIVEVLVVQLVLLLTSLLGLHVGERDVKSLVHEVIVGTVETQATDAQEETQSSSTQDFISPPPVTPVRKPISTPTTPQPGSASTSHQAQEEVTASQPVDEEELPVEDEKAFHVIDVIDGDTIKVSDGTTVATIRIIGINTPETVAPHRPVECFGKEASRQAHALLDDKDVFLYNDTTQDNLDKYGRYLRYVSVGAKDYGKEMIENGYAYEYTYHLPYLHQKEYKEAEREARSESRGLWSASTCSGVK